MLTCLGLHTRRANVTGDSLRSVVPPVASPPLVCVGSSHGPSPGVLGDRGAMSSWCDGPVTDEPPRRFPCSCWWPAIVGVVGFVDSAMRTTSAVAAVSAETVVSVNKRARTPTCPRGLGGNVDHPAASAVLSLNLASTCSLLAVFAPPRRPHPAGGAADPTAPDGGAIGVRLSAATVARASATNAEVVGAGRSTWSAAFCRGLA